MKLGVNIDHIATLREARKINEPDPLQAVFIAKDAGADQITIHLREDRRHIQDFDVARIIQNSFLPINVECSTNYSIIEIISALKPHRATLVPENRQEVTTEGGLNLIENKKVINAIKILQENEIKVSLFIDPDKEQIDKAKELNVDMIELHTGKFANLFLALNTNINHTHIELFEKYSRSELEILFNNEIKRIKNMSEYATSLGLEVAAGHGLNYQNVKYITNIKTIKELNIGHSIIANSIFKGLDKAIREMIELIRV